MGEDDLCFCQSHCAPAVGTEWLAMGSSYPLVRDGANRIEPNGPTLAYSLHLPSANPTRAALIAHPYGRLGGSRSDHVVVALAELLCELGYAVVRYDARGAGESEGSASWTCVLPFSSYRVGGELH